MRTSDPSITENCRMPRGERPPAWPPLWLGVGGRDDLRLQLDDRQLGTRQVAGIGPGVAQIELAADVSTSRGNCAAVTPPAGLRPPASRPWRAGPPCRATSSTVPVGRQLARAADLETHRLAVARAGSACGPRRPARPTGRRRQSPRRGSASGNAPGLSRSRRRNTATCCGTSATSTTHTRQRRGQQLRPPPELAPRQVLASR